MSQTTGAPVSLPASTPQCEGSRFITSDQIAHGLGIRCAGSPARQPVLTLPPCQRFLVLIPDSSYDSFKLVRIRKCVPLGEPTADRRHLCADGLDDRDRFLRCL